MVSVLVRVVEGAERNIITRTTAFLQVLTDGKYCYLPSRPRLRLPALHPKVRLRLEMNQLFAAAVRELSAPVVFVGELMGSTYKHAGVRFCGTGGRCTLNG